MDIGSFSIITAFVANLLSMLGFFNAARTEDRPLPEGNAKKELRPGFFLDLGRLTFYTNTLAVVIAGIYLYYLIFTHQFQIKYVYQYTSSDLSFGLLLSTFWAGQEGSFLFWTILITLAGLLFLKKSGKYEAKAMVFLTLVLAFFLAILLKASPFQSLANVPSEGAGLNPLLQNFWMIIHPPILFIGYAAITFPFILALAALWKKDYNGWLVKSLPWTIFSALTLGAGIIIGAFWAYETLGWGGYWGWDPVENSSLIPWLTILALLHGILVQRRNQTLPKTNFFLAIISFVLVLYATFLTRSGVLEDFSVHSFQNLGFNNLLIVFMAGTLALGLGFFIGRFRDIPVEPMDMSSLNRENGLLASMIVFSASAFLTFLGTSSPIITGLLGDPSQVDTSFYNQVNMPVGALMAIFLGITPFLLWIEKDMKSLPRRLLLPAILAVVATIITSVAGDLSTGETLFLLAAYFALFANSIVLFHQWKISWRNIAGPLSHFGVGILLVSIIISGNYASEERIMLEQGKPVTVMDHHLTYQGLKPMADGKNILEIEVNSGGQSYLARPRIYRTKNSEVMREPHVKSGFISDLYISPLELRPAAQSNHGSHLSLVKGETKKVEGLSVTFLNFDMKPHDDGSSFNVGAVLQVGDGDHTHTVMPVLTMGAGGKHSEPVEIPTHGKYEPEISVTLNALDADKKSVDLHFQGLGGSPSASESRTGEQLIIEFSRKPFMSILWLGSILLLVGSVIALTHRLKTE
jgi:cytochrome c-type biogenesis protein CcmF